jgi:hypothetical protein
MLLNDALSLMTCSSQKLSTMCSTHSDKFVLPPFRSVCINYQFCSWFMNNFSEIFKRLRNTLEEFLVSFGENFCLCLYKTQFIPSSVVLDIVIDFSLPPLSDFFLAYHLHVHFLVLDSVTTLEIVILGSVTTGNGTNVAI